jgi:protocatechuate 3,4-dioxygenase beta subunit
MALKKKMSVKKKVAKKAEVYFSEKKSVEVVQKRSGPKANKRAKFLVDSLVKHMHAFIKETEPTLDEWMYGIQFLTKTGHLSNDWRQEFILLSDTLGISMLVETINNRKTTGETESTVLGPFHVSNAPRYPNGANICLDGKGAPLLVSGSVRNVKGKAIAGATLDVWQTNEDGFYDVQQKGIQPDNNLRGVFTADAKGHFNFKSAYPRFYPIPYDGTVGDMLTALDRKPNRPAHIHFIVSAPGYKPVTTHLFTPDCPWLKEDAVFGVKESLIADFKNKGDHWEVEWDFVLSKA